jgi:hypothetical protein
MAEQVRFTMEARNAYQILAVNKAKYQFGDLGLCVRITLNPSEVNVTYGQCMLMLLDHLIYFLMNYFSSFLSAPLSPSYFSFSLICI